jgi:hypothetical protein
MHRSSSIINAEYMHSSSSILKFNRFYKKKNAWDGTNDYFDRYAD